MNHYAQAIQQITAIKCPREIKEKRSKEGKVISRTPLPWHVVDTRENHDRIDVALHVPLGYSAADLEKQTDAIFAAVGHYVSVTNRGGVVIVSIAKRDFPDVIHYSETMLQESESRTVLLGYDITGRPVTHNFRVPHLLIGAMPGYGKTDLIRFILLQLISRFTPDQLHIDIIDGKGFSFLPFRGVPHIRNIVRDVSGAAYIMAEAKRVMNQRSNQIWASEDRSKARGYRWHMVFVDELAVLSPSFQVTKAQREVATLAYADMAAVACVGREAGVGMVLCTQRPDANVVHPQVKQAMDASIAFRTKTLTNSEIILDKGGAEKLPQGKPGRGIYSAQGECIFQAPYVGDDDAWCEVLAPYKFDWREQEDERSAESGDSDDVY